ncbi:MAG: hypothetical protein ILNGONEN_00778 [Syntrophorhabdaceae bacterium]|nr:hypothetical protein [Syntrophorhabdaceae bacterium]
MNDFKLGFVKYIIPLKINLIAIKPIVCEPRPKPPFRIEFFSYQKLLKIADTILNLWYLIWFQK